MEKEEFIKLEGELSALEKEWYERAIQVAPEFYPWVPYPLLKFARLLAIAMEVNPGPMVELGAGIGTKVLMARAMGVETLGVENNEIYLKEAARLGASVVEGDIRDFDVAPYGIVYTYHPLFPEAHEAGFEGYIQGSMSVGSVFICPKVACWPGNRWKILYRDGEDVVAVKVS